MHPPPPHLVVPQQAQRLLKTGHVVLMPRDERLELAHPVGTKIGAWERWCLQMDFAVADATDVGNARIPIPKSTSYTNPPLPVLLRLVARGSDVFNIRLARLNLREGSSNL